ncbi:CBS domain-containing protein [Thiospirochaeta perfilievii]|uniref:CBS domain-containing protein n=2 Tax=Thiospirochaeta perfilievii TaxID=252967 RepID=A0A5C1Q7V3_9SPIO|nr:CBS domain-containing protein [Thiospirochaeta perfilievii]
MILFKKESYMKLSSLIDKDFILTGNNFNSVLDCVDAFIDLFEKKKILTVSSNIVKQKVRDREKLGGTVLPNGLALPHGRCEAVDDLIIGVWVPKKPLSTEDGEVKILFFLITSISGSALYLPVLSAIAKHCLDDETMPKILNGSRDEIHDIFDTITIKTEVTVEDIMTANPITCTKHTTLGQLSDIFYKNGLSYLPVVDENRKQIGEVTIKDVLSRGVPDYIKRIGNIKFLKTLEPFEALLRDEDKILVKDIMRASKRNISKDASIIEAVVMMTDKGYRHLPVIDNKEVIGIISETDVLKKVIRG